MASSGPATFVACAATLCQSWTNPNGRPRPALVSSYLECSPDLMALYSAAVRDALPPPPPGGQERSPGIADAGRRVDGLAYAALVTGILSLVLSVVLIGLPGLLLGPGAAIMGFISHRRIAASRVTLGGGGIALAGLLLGVIGFVLSFAFLVFAFLVGGLFQCGGPGPHQPGIRC